jgi:hypothetical protein
MMNMDGMVTWNIGNGRITIKRQWYVSITLVFLRNHFRDVFLNLVGARVAAVENLNHHQFSFYDDENVSILQLNFLRLVSLHVLALLSVFVVVSVKLEEV